MTSLTRIYLIKQANERLKAASIGVSIELRNDRLSLRATLPPKPGEFGNFHQQRICLKVYANLEGIKYAESEAQIVGGLLAQKRFDWARYIEEPSQPPETISYWIKALEDKYFSERPRNSTTTETWKHEYLKPFSLLPENIFLSEERLKTALLEWTDANTRSRRRYALAYCKIADLAGLEHSLRDLIGDYAFKAVSPRSLPSDELIIRSYQSISDQAWRWIYGVMAAYGLRNHEAYFLDFEDYPIAYINRGKTNERFIWPLYPEWPDQWGLINISRPDCSGNTNSAYGNLISKGFKKLKISFTPYDLRHSWARRSFDFGMDVTMASKMLGHSTKIHTEIYRHWIDRDSFNRIYQQLITNPDRPLPPC
ncbi:tyrosine-type recombinase/integrase [Microcystis sp. LEGE 00066]|uniref:tyrosine-type recombinase/integrase n=1 Tax=Microcystis sp. LEGE 00066 TaxID=1828685 RepID=UPI00187E3C7F|nr:tyrosine-type recombinase/integrase [Microcystis sp. LEGE 00066]MBE9263067.1 tyrosine-type recombinase/integrase [Microcystis sp. LEGE 00066]